MADTNEQEGTDVTGGADQSPDAAPVVSGPKLTGAAAKAAAKAAAARLAAGKPAPDKAVGSDRGSARVCNQNDRAEGGMRRYKIRALNLGQRGYRYVLATDRAAAEECYLAAEGVTELPKDVTAAQFATTELPD